MSHGGDLYGAAQRRKNIDRWIDFSSNINPLGVPAPVLQALTSNLEADLTRYPDSQCRELRQALATYLDCDPERLLMGNGVSQLLDLLLPQLPEPVGLPVPCFVDYHRALKGKKVIQLNTANTNFQFEPDETFLQSCQSLVIGNPNNPTGTMLTSSQLQKLKSWVEAGGTLVADQSFIDLTFDPTLSGVEQLNLGEDRQVWIFSSVTKSLALPGLRLGWLQGPIEQIHDLAHRQYDWSVSGPACRMAQCFHLCTPYLTQTRAWLQQQSSHMHQQLKLLGFDVFPSVTNFILLRHPKALEIADQLEKRGILIRRCGDFVGLDHRYLRTAIKSAEHNNLLLAELHSILKG